MKASQGDLSIEVFTTCPATLTDTHGVERPGFYMEGGSFYRDRVIEATQWTEDCGFDGMLVYIDNSLVNNWSVAQMVMEHSETLTPLIATQPVYMHPYWVAKSIATFSHIYGRRIALNMLAGAFRGDLIALGDPTPHDRRYDRMTEFTQILQQLLDGSGKAVTYEGEFYQIKNLKVQPSIDKDMAPIVLMSGSSEAGLATAKTLDAVAVRYPEPVSFYEERPLEKGIDYGIRMGIIARDDAEEAWKIAEARFQEDRRGQVVHQMAMKASDSKWHKDLTAIKQEELTEAFPYWLTPFHNYKTFCPYLVGDFDRISSIVARYIQVGFRTFITDIPLTLEELECQQKVLQMAIDKAAARAFE